MWREEKIGNELDVIRGVSFPKTAKESEYQDGKVACLRTANVQKEVDWNDLWFIDKDHVNREEQFVQENDILISTANSLELLGKVSLVQKLPYESTLGTFIVIIRVPDGNSPKFIYYQLCGRDFLEQVWEKASTTTNISNLSTTKLKDITLKFPPLPTQHRIVEKIEELFSELDNGVENLKKAQQQLKTYRQAVLKDAFEGKLTKEWRALRQAQDADGLPTPDELLEQIKAERNAHRQRELAEWEKEVEQWEKDGKPGRKPRKPTKLSKLDEDSISNNDGQPNGWFYIPFEQIGFWQGGGTPSKRNPEFWANGSVSWVSPKDMKRKDIKETEDFITESAIENSSAKWIKKGSILFVVRSGILRRILPVAVAKTDLTVNQDLQAFTSVTQTLPEYLYWYAFGNENAIRNSCAKDGTTVESIDSNSLKAYPIPFCSYDEQKEIVNEIESRLSVVDQLEQTINENLQKSEALRQSILKKAFGGELVE